MSTPKTIDRKTFLATGVAAWATVSLGACSDDGGGTDDGGGATGGTGTGGTGTGGTGGGDPSYVCTTNTSNGDHSHPWEVPSSDVLALADKVYTLMEGGTGHTHTVELHSYDYLYLQAGTQVMKTSSNDAGHEHPCLISCMQA
jgi:hypothetical protein